jgi:hypothetical protein
MKFLEKDLEQIIWEADKEVLSEKGLHLDGKLKRQLKIGNYGIADLIHFKRPEYRLIDNKRRFVENGLIEIIELKNEKISISAFMQAINYVQGIKRYLEKRNFREYRYDYTYRITLIGRHLDKNSSICYLPDLICSSEFQVEIYTYNYDLNGIQFTNESNYKLSKEGF